MAKQKQETLATATPASIEELIKQLGEQHRVALEQADAAFNQRVAELREQRQVAEAAEQLRVEADTKVRLKAALAEARSAKAAAAQEDAGPSDFELALQARVAPALEKAARISAKLAEFEKEHGTSLAELNAMERNDLLDGLPNEGRPGEASVGLVAGLQSTVQTAVEILNGAKTNIADSTRDIRAFMLRHPDPSMQAWDQGLVQALHELACSNDSTIETLKMTVQTITARYEAILAEKRKHAGSAQGFRFERRGGVIIDGIKEAKAREAIGNDDGRPTQGNLNYSVFRA
jgi:hypothetical protein